MMSLAEAVKEVADSIDVLVKDASIDSEVRIRLAGYVGQLRIAVKAAGQDPASTPNTYGGTPLGVSCVSQTKEDGLRMNLKESPSPEMLYVSGGDADGTFVAANSNMPIGTIVPIGNQWYRRTKNCLIFCKEVTDHCKVE